MKHPSENFQKHAYFSIIVGIFISIIDATAINLLLPNIAEAMNASTAKSILLINSYQIAILVMLLPFAAIGERCGHGRVYIFGLVLFTAASLLAIFVDSLQALVAARVLQGIGASGIMAVNAALLRLIYSDALLARKLAAVSIVAAIAAFSGPVLASIILSSASWQWLFALQVPIGTIAILAGYRSLPKNQSTSSALSVAAILLNTAAFSLFFMGVTHLTSGSEESSSRIGWAMVGSSLLFACVYVNHQSRQSQPLFPLDLLGIRDFSLSISASASAYLALTMIHIGLPFIMLNTYRYTAIQASVLLMAWPVSMILFSPVAGRLTGRHSNGVISSIGMALFATGIFSLAVISAQPADLDLFWRIFLCGAGFALFRVPNNVTIVTSSPMERSGSASAMLSVSRMAGQCLGAAGIALLFTIWPGQDGTAEKAGMLIAGGCAVVSGLLGLVQGRRM